MFALSTAPRHARQFELRCDIPVARLGGGDGVIVRLLRHHATHFAANVASISARVEAREQISIVK